MSSKYAQAAKKNSSSNKDKLSVRQIKKLERADNMIHQGGSLLQAGRLLLAIEDKLRAPFPPPYLQVKGACLFALGKYQESRFVFKEVVERDRKNVVAYYYLGKIAMKLNEPEHALTFFTAGLGCDPEHTTLRVNHVQTLLHLQHFEQAKQHVETLRKQSPEDPHYLKLAGEVNRRTYQLPEAVECYREAIEKLIELPPQPSTSEAEGTFDVEKHERTLWQVLAQLKNAGVHAFPVAGTLLGLVRDGHLLPFDKDIDLGLPFNEMKKATECLISNGWTELGNSYGMVSPRAFAHPKTGLAMDLFAFNYDSDTKSMITGMWMPNVPFEWNVITEHPEINLEPKKSPAGSVWMLKNPEEFLVGHYGEGWRFPDPLFATFVAEQSLRSFSYLTQCYAYIRLFSAWNKGDFKKVKAYVHNILKESPEDYLMLEVKSRLAEFESAAVSS